MTQLSSTIADLVSVSIFCEIYSTADEYILLPTLDAEQHLPNYCHDVPSLAAFAGRHETAPLSSDVGLPGVFDLLPVVVTLHDGQGAPW